MPDLAAIIEEGERLEANWPPGMRYRFDLIHFYADHGPALLAVARAAVEWDAAEQAYIKEGDGGGPAAWRSFRANESLRAAVRGEEEGR